MSEFIKKFSLQLHNNDSLLNAIHNQICSGLTAIDKFINKMKDKEDNDITDILDTAKIFADLYYVVSNSNVDNKST